VGTKINAHEPSRYLFLGITDAAEALIDAPEGDPFMEKLFALDHAFHPNGRTFSYMIPAEDHLKVDLNGQYVYDAKFFLPEHLVESVAFLHGLYHSLIERCESFRRWKGFGDDLRTDVLRYSELQLKIGPETRANVQRAVAAVRGYFHRPHVSGFVLPVMR